MRVTVIPPAGAIPLSTTFPVDICPESTFAGTKVSVVTTGGFTVSPADKELAGESVTVMFGAAITATGSVVTLNMPLLAPAGMTRFPLAGTVAALVLSLIREIVTPPVGAGPPRVTVPTTLVPPVTEPGLNVKDVMTVGSTVRAPAMLKLEPELADTMTFVDAATADVVAVNVCELLPAGTVTPGGTVTDGSELISETNTPPAGATTLMATVPVEGFPPMTLAGMKLTRTTGGGSTIRLTVTMIEPVEAVTITGVAVLTAPATTIKV